jgi:hypothetical protein
MTLTLHFVSKFALAAAQTHSISRSFSGATRAGASFHISFRPGFAAVQSNRNQTRSNPIRLNQTQSNQLAQKKDMGEPGTALIKKNHLNQFKPI